METSKTLSTVTDRLVQSRLKKIFGISVCLVFISGCVSTDTMDKADLRSVYLDKRGGLIIDFDIQNTKCQKTTLTVQNQSTKRLFDILYLPPSWRSDLPYAIKSLPPADYKISKAECYFGHNSGGYSYHSDKTFEGISTAYPAFKVEAGKVLYPGTLQVIKAKKGKYLRYGIVDRETTVRSELAKVYPNLDAKFEKNLLKAKPAITLQDLLKTSKSVGER